jgi:UDP-N-acetylglucosamine 2-epimerase (non-hydrolysing)
MRLLVISSSRADWGLLAPVVEELRRRPAMTVELALTGQHFMVGSASRQVLEAEGIEAEYEIDAGLTDDDRPEALADAMGRVTRGVGDAIARGRPHMVIVLGDRYEILAAVSAAVLAAVPVAHLCGGDVTEGAIDDAIRHAITKLSALHFVTNVASARRVAQLGESGDRIHNVGSPGLDRIVNLGPLEKSEILADLGLPADARYFLATCHPATLSQDPQADCRAMLAALERFATHWVILTGTNADPGGRTIDADVRAFAAAHPNAVYHETLGSRRYFSALKHADVVIGNSSSGLYEAPSFKVPTVNIGDRQKGRLRAYSVIDCPPHPDAIYGAITQALQLDCSAVVNPYGDGQAASRIADVLEGLTDPSALVRKTFVDRIT